MPRPRRRRAQPSAFATIALGLVLTACLPKAAEPQPTVRDHDPAADGAGGRGGEANPLGADLILLHEAYVAYLSTATPALQPFASPDPALLVTNDRVAVDATASGDPALLERDLRALGLVGAARFGPIVSGYLPIEALPSAAALTTLRSMRAAKAGLR